MCWEGLKNEINTKEAEAWRKAMNNKSTLKMYRTHRCHITAVRMWKNNTAESIIRNHQAGTPLTKHKTGKTEEEKRCDCGAETETHEHLLLRCERFSELREKYGVTTETKMEDILEFTKEGNLKLQTYVCEVHQIRFGGPRG